MLGIAAVERDTRFSKDTLRVWERRYGFPVPLRDANDERVYPEAQVEKLRLLRRLVDNGHRPGKIVSKTFEELLALAEEGKPRPKYGKRMQAEGTALPSAALEAHQTVATFIDLLRTHQTDALRQAMSTTLMRIGLRDFIIEIAAPLCHEVGEAWARGEIQVFEEHLFTEQIAHLLRNTISTIPAPPESAAVPRVLLTTFPEEPHGLGLLMAEALLALQGSVCISLGVQTPIGELAMAAKAQRIDIVALSFSAYCAGRSVISGLQLLRDSLPPHVEIWAGGTSPVLARTSIADVHVFQTLAGIAQAVERWRLHRQANHLGPA
jgi:DNA-binding transcriptional MerR regulator/methylmalonyl-CoA mutase cobalamin-binding subunit